MYPLCISFLMFVTMEDRQKPKWGRIFIPVILLLFISSCRYHSKNGLSEKTKSMELTCKKGEYGYDLKLLQTYLKPLELKNGESRVLIAPEYQGRVLTSTSSGLKGFSYGWINHGLIEKNKVQKHINAYGGEERLWFGPEGGQFSIFFRKGEPFDFEHWQTPACIDTEPFNIVGNDSNSVTFTKNVKLNNYSGTEFQFDVFRKVSLISRDKAEKLLQAVLPSDVKMVAYQSENRIENTGTNEWTKTTGALSVWMLGMLNPSLGVTIVVPYKKGDYGKIVNSSYFGEIPEDRLKTDDRAIYLKADGKYRSKIGIPPLRVLPRLGSYDAINKILTILECTVDTAATEYVNSAWKLQEKPFAGDVINAYNDGPLADGSQMGPFYELETSSKAGFLKPGEKLEHIQQTYHFQGNEEELNRIAEKVLGVSVEKIKSVFN